MEDDIVLTVPQIQIEKDEAIWAFHQPCGPDNDLEIDDYVDRYVCRAQVRKVVEEWEKRDGFCPRKKRPWGCYHTPRGCQVCQFLAFIDTLKAALEER